MAEDSKMSSNSFINRVRRINIGAREYQVRVCKHHVTKPSRAKVWDRYSGDFIVRGTGTYHNWDDRLEKIKPGSFIHHHPGKSHYTEYCREGWRGYTIATNTDLYRRFLELGLINDKQGVIQIGPSRALENAFARLSKTLDYSYSAGQCILAVTSIFAQIQDLADEGRFLSKEEMLVETARQQLEQDLRAIINLEELAEAFGLSYSCFRHIFKKHVGMPPAAYRNEQRLLQAQLLLNYKQMRIGDVADELGYNDQFAFSRQFKKRFKVSPKQYNLQQKIY